MTDPVALADFFQTYFAQPDGHPHAEALGRSAQLRANLTRFEQQLHDAHTYGDHAAERELLLHIGTIHNQLGDERRAITLLERALLLMRQEHERQGESYVLYSLGVAHNQLGDARGALQCYAQSLAILRENGHQRGEAYVLTSLGDVYVALADTHRAWECYTQSRELFRTLGDSYAEANVGWSMGEMLAGQREYVRAAELMQPLVELEQSHSHTKAQHHANVLAQVRARMQPSDA